MTAFPSLGLHRFGNERFPCEALVKLANQRALLRQQESKTQLARIDVESAAWHDSTKHSIYRQHFFTNGREGMFGHQRWRFRILVWLITFILLTKSPGRIHRTRRRFAVTLLLQQSRITLFTVFVASICCCVRALPQTPSRKKIEREERRNGYAFSWRRGQATTISLILGTITIIQPTSNCCSRSSSSTIAGAHSPRSSSASSSDSSSSTSSPSSSVTLPFRR